MQIPPSYDQQQFFQLIAESSDHTNLCDVLAEKIVDLADVDVCAIATSEGEILGSWISSGQINKSVSTEAELVLSESEPQLLIEGVAVSSIAAAIADGIIVLGKRQATSWSIETKKLLQSLALSIPAAIRLQQQQQQLDTAKQHQQLLNQLNSFFRSFFSGVVKLDVLLESVIQATVKSLNLDGGSILTLKYKNPLQPYQADLEKTKVQTIASWQQSQHYQPPHAFILAESPMLAEAIESAPQPLAIFDRVSEKSSTANSDQRDILLSHHPQAWLCGPLTGRIIKPDDSTHLVLGFLVLWSDQLRNWTTAELELIASITAQIYQAIIHHQTLHKVRSVVDNRTSQLTLSIDLQSRLQETMRQQIEQLKRINELKDDFLSSISHELKTPLTSMKMAIKMLRQSNLPATLQTKYLDILEQEWNREYNLIKDLLTLQEVESGEIGFHPQQLQLNRLVAQIAEQFQTQWQPKTGVSLELSLADDLSLYTDAENLEHILSELLLNASKYSDPNTTVTLEANRVFQNQTPQIVVTVTNFGAGIAPEEIPHIFEKFRRGKGVTERAVPGTGLGLALVKSLVEYQGGKIEVTSQPTSPNSNCYRTCFTLTLPQA